VTAIQRFGGTLNLNVHFHTTLVPDAVFIEEGVGPARFEPLNAPSDDEVAAILARIVRRAANVLQRFDEQFECEDATDELASLQAWR
jgi:hypothetical protein